MAVRPLVKRENVKKRTKRFVRHQSDRYVKLKVNKILFYNKQHHILICILFKLKAKLEKTKGY